MHATVIFKDGREEDFPSQTEAERFAFYWMIHHKESITVRCGDFTKQYVHESEVH